jgi:hypothetical protein
MCLAARGNVTSIELAVCKDFAMEGAAALQTMIWERAHAGDRASKTRRRVQKRDPEMERDVSTTAGRHSALRHVCAALSGRHGQPCHNRSLQPLSEGGGARLSESANDNLLLRLENIEARGRPAGFFLHLRHQFRMSALQHYVAPCLQRHATTDLWSCRR